MTEEIKKIEKEIDALIEERCALSEKLIVVDGNKIILRKSSPDWNKHLEIGEKIHSLLDEVKKKEDEYLEENADVVLVEIVDLAYRYLLYDYCSANEKIKAKKGEATDIDGKPKYARIIIRQIFS